MAVFFADACATCGEFHYYGPEDVDRYVHALRTIAEMAARSDAHPDMQFEEIARDALDPGRGVEREAEAGSLGSSGPASARSTVPPGTDKKPAEESVSD